MAKRIWNWFKIIKLPVKKLGIRVDKSGIQVDKKNERKKERKKVHLHERTLGVNVNVMCALAFQVENDKTQHEKIVGIWFKVLKSGIQPRLLNSIMTCAVGCFRFSRWKPVTCI